MINLYETNQNYVVKINKDRQEWLKSRLGTIGGSEASCVIDKNPFKSKEEFTLQFLSNVITEKKDNKAMKEGRELEQHIREIYKIENSGKYDVQYQENTILYHILHKQLSYSPDGLIYDHKRDRCGLWECKTTFIRSVGELENWNQHIPPSYYIQCLHGLIVTNFDFFELTAKIKVYDKETKETYSLIKTYHVERSDVQEDIDFLLDNELAYLRDIYKT